MWDEEGGSPCPRGVLTVCPSESWLRVRLGPGLALPVSGVGTAPLLGLNSLRQRNSPMVPVPFSLPVRSERTAVDRGDGGRLLLPCAFLLGAGRLFPEVVTPGDPLDVEVEEGPSSTDEGSVEIRAGAPISSAELVLLLAPVDISGREDWNYG